MITLEALQKRTRFSCDLIPESNELPPWSEGDLLIKNDAMLVGCAHRPRPACPVRLLLYARHPSHADETSTDPWHLMAVDRPACFVVGAITHIDDITQYTLVEIGPAELTNPTQLQLNDQARAAVTQLFQQACAQPSAPYESDLLFMRATGIDHAVAVENLLTCATIDEAQLYLEKHDPNTIIVGTSEDSAAEQQDHEHIDQEELQSSPVVANEVSHTAYQESDESWIVALAESILSESAAKSYLAADIRSTQAEPDSATDAPQVAAAASALYDSLHEQPAQAEANDPIPNTNQNAHLAPETQAADAATALYATLHLAEARIDETPSYTDIPTHAGLKFYQATNRRLAAHPALEYAESQRNFARLLNRSLGGALISRLYAGDVTPASETERAAEARRLWFDPLSQCNFFPLLSDDVDSYLEGMRLQYGRFAEDADAASYAQVHSQLGLIDAALHGDTDACIQLIEADRTRLHLPYRFEFSVSFDVEQRQALINVFLPQKALFPLSMQSQEHDSAFSASGFNQRYQGVACALGIIALYLVKMDAAWVQDLALNAWYRTEDNPKCVYSLRVNERALVEHTTQTTHQAFQALKDMQARIHSGNHHELLGLDPLFSLHEALDHPFGFKTFANGWTFPPVFTAITGEPTAENLDRTVSMLLDLVAQGKNAQAYEAAQVHEKLYRNAWLDTLDPSLQGLSCENELEERLALSLPSHTSRVVLPRCLGQLYHILGTLANDAGNTQAARPWLEQAVRLNPVGALSLIELAKSELTYGNIKSADKLLDAARQVAASPYALAQVAKYRAMCHARHGHSELAYYLYSYAFHLYESDTHRMVCLAGINDLDLDRTRSEQNVLSLHPPQPAPASLLESLEYLQSHGRQAGISEAVLDVVEPVVEAALTGGPLPDAAYVDAYLCALHAQGKDVERARSLVLNVHTVRFCDFPFSDYVFKPILLCDSDIVYTIDSKLGLVPDTEGTHAGLVAVPYIDPHAGLTLQVLGTADIDTNRPIKVLASPIKLAAAPFKNTPFRLLRNRDFPAFPIAATADTLNRVYAPDQQLDATRARRDIDVLRDFGNPDNILVVLAREGVRPEGVWATLVHMDSDNTLYARLANEPYDNFGVHMGDLRPLHLQSDPETGLVLAFIR